MGNLSAVITADTSQFTKAIENAKQLLEQYANTAKKASTQINGTASVTQSQVTAYNRVVKALQKVNSGTMSTTQQQKTLEKQIKELKIQWENLSNAARRSDFGKSMAQSIRSAEAQLKGLNTQLDKTKSKMNGLSKGKFSIGGLGNIVGDISSMSGLGSLGNIGGILSKIASPAGAATAALGLLAVGFADNVNKAAEFEEAISHLSSLTGMKGKDLDYLKDAAIDLGSKTTQTASQVAEAFQIVGSKKPDLLKSKEGLVEVTEACITLAEASEMTVEDASNALTNMLNQFGLPASKATEVINLLAAASQAGAGNINYVSDAISKCGSIASTLNIPMSEVIAEIEMLAQKGEDSSEAGTHLRNVMLKLASSGKDKLNPTTQGLIGAMKNLKKAGMDVTKAEEMFGEGNANTAVTLSNTTVEAEKMNTSIQGTNTAEEQAKTNTDNFKGSVTKLKSAYEGVQLSIDDSNGSLKTFIDLLTTALIKIQEYIKWMNKFRNAKAEYESTGHVSSENVNGEYEKLRDDRLSGLRGSNDKNKESAYYGYLKLYNEEIRNAKKTVEGYVKSGEKDLEKAARLGLAQLKASRTSFIEKSQSILGRGKKAEEDEDDPKNKPKNKPKSDETLDTLLDGDKNKNKNKTPKPAKGSLGDLENQLSELQKKYKNGLIKLTPDDYNEKVNDLQEKIKEKKIILGLEADADSLTGLESQLSELQKKYKDGLIDIEPEEYNAQVKELQDKIALKKVALGIEPYVDPNSLEGISKQITEKQKELKLAVSDEDRAEIQAEIDELTGQKEAIELKIAAPENLKKIREELAEALTPETKSTFSTVSSKYENKDEIDDLQERLDKNDELIATYKKAREEMEKTGNTGEMQYSMLGDALEILVSEQGELTEELEKMIQKLKKLDDINNKLNRSADMINSVGTAFSALGSSFESPALNIAGIIAQAIANIVAGYAQATKNASEWGRPLAWATFTVSGLAEIAGVIASIHSLSKYANGGIIGGYTSIGDYSLARVNAGEMIMNRAQQNHLWNILNGEMTNTSSSTPRGTVEFKIRGPELVGVLNNYNKKNNRI